MIKLDNLTQLNAVKTSHIHFNATMNKERNAKNNCRTLRNNNIKLIIKYS